MRPELSRGRRFPDHDSPYRGLYQRDRDRIVHAAAFRRLQYKTQVFVNVLDGDYFRNRLTHTLEVTQIARTLARALHLNEDLAEALALAHDLGHGPFGHSGEAALNEMMHGHGGFDHNAQGLRIVDQLEHRYARFPGLNLTYETREGYAKNRPKGDVSPSSRASLGFEANELPTLEAQLVNHADEIAYNAHDLDDGLVSGALGEDTVREVALWRDTEAQVLQEDPAYRDDQRLRWSAIVRRLIATLVTDMLNETQRRLKDQRIQSLDDVRAAPAKLIAFSPELIPQKKALEHFLMTRFYRVARVKDLTDHWRERLKQLFAAYLQQPALLPLTHLQRAESGHESLERVICDYVSGMTDRFANRVCEEVLGTK